MNEKSNHQELPAILSDPRLLRDYENGRFPLHGLILKAFQMGYYEGKKHSIQSLLNKIEAES